MPQLVLSVQGVETQKIPLVKDRTTLGRKPGNDIVLDNMIVSGQHCAFELHGLADVFVEDLGSTNGTFVNNGKVKGRVQLHDGDKVAVGPFRLRYVQTLDQPASGFGETQAMMADTGQAAMHAIFTVASGSSAGLEIPVVKAVTTFGKPGVCVVSVSHRRQGYFVTHLEGAQAPLLNGQPVGQAPALLSSEDVLELAGTKMLFQLRD